MCLISENHIKQWFAQRECLDGTLKLSESTVMCSREAIFHCLGEHLRSTEEPQPNCCYWKYVLMHMKVNCPENLEKAKTTPQCMLPIVNKCLVICCRAKLHPYKEPKPAPCIAAQPEIKFSFILGCIKKVMPYTLENYSFQLLDLIFFTLLL